MVVGWSLLSPTTFYSSILSKTIRTRNLSNMKVTIISTLALSTAVAGLTCPTNSGGGCGQYTVSGLGARKQQIQSAGGTTKDLAIAMMETENMGTDYVLVASCSSPHHHS